MPRAVFVDRDGVLNRLVLNPANGRYESPHHPDDFELMPDALDALARLQALGAHLFLVSNQPSAALGKTTIEEIQAIHARLEASLDRANIRFSAFYYCYHHPAGTVPPYAGPCPCRKPSPFFLQQAHDQFQIELRDSWMIGDRDTDVECGGRAGCRTILVRSQQSEGARRCVAPNFEVGNFSEAVSLVERMWHESIAN